jgi:predicted Fe-S protein YdhL (DUF1289 family)
LPPEIPLHPASPCVLVCQIDAETDLCVGCHRTQAEIIGWRHYTAEQKTDLLQQTAIRQAVGQAELGPGVSFSSSLAKVKVCGQCGDALVCGPLEPGGDCWCDRLPNIMPLQPEADSCLCPACLEQAIQGRIKAQAPPKASSEKAQANPVD